LVAEIRINVPTCQIAQRATTTYTIREIIDEVAVSAAPFPKMALTRSKSNRPTRPQFNPPTIKRPRVIIFIARIFVLRIGFHAVKVSGFSFVPIEKEAVARPLLAGRRFRINVGSRT
jgi:hypothetical protein